MKITTVKQARTRLRRWGACGSKGNSMKQMWENADTYGKWWVIRRLMWQGRLPVESAYLGQYTVLEDIPGLVEAYLRRNPWKVIRAAFVK